MGASEFGNRYPQGVKRYDSKTFDLGTDAMQMAFDHYYKPSTDFSSFSEYIAIVEDIRKGQPNSTSGAAYLARNSGTELKETYIIIANVKIFDFLPQTTKYSDGRSRNNDLINMKSSLKMEFEANGEHREPNIGEWIKVNWRKKSGMPLFDWDFGVYLGPANPSDPQIEPPMDENNIAQLLFHKAGMSDGLASQAPSSGYNSMAGSPGATKKDFNGEPSPTTKNTERHWDKPVYAPRKKASPLPSKIYNKKEIYVEKKLDYPNLENINIIPYAPPERIEIVKDAKKKSLYRKKDKAFLLPEGNVHQRANTKMIIINETGDRHSAVYESVGRSPLMHFSIAMNSNTSTPGQVAALAANECTVRINIPYGLAIGDVKNAFSENCVGCVISSPFDASGKNFLNLNDSFQGAITPERIAYIRDHISSWVQDKTVPGGFEAFIMGPFGTPGLKTGPSISSNDFAAGRLVWTKTGHYVLPTMSQAYVLYELINSLINDSPSSNYSWGFTKPRRNNHQLSWSFPAVGGGAATSTSSNFLSKKSSGMFEATSGFPWGRVGEGRYRKQSKFRQWWENELVQNRDISGIVSNSRWKTYAGGTFLEYYLLSRSLQAGHREAWYIALGAASETYPRQYGGVGYGPSPLPLAADKNRLLQKGQQMWAEATRYIREGVTNRRMLYTKSLARTVGKNQPTTSKQKKKRQRDMRRQR
jgi:hypothetical protein